MISAKLMRIVEDVLHRPDQMETRTPAQIRHAERKAAGICINCRLPAEPGRTLCARHLEKARLGARAKNRARGIPERKCTVRAYSARRPLPYGECLGEVELVTSLHTERGLIPPRAISGCEQKPPLWVIALRARGQLIVYDGKEWRCFLPA